MTSYSYAYLLSDMCVMLAFVVVLPLFFPFHPRFIWIDDVKRDIIELAEQLLRL